MMKIIQKYYPDARASDPKNVNILKAICFQLMLLAVLLFGYSAQAQDPPQYGTPFNGVPDPRDVNMYQVHLRIFGPNSNLQSITSRLDQIRDLGINVIYLMPIFPHGTDAQSTTSPYCIKDFKAVASEYGNLNSLRQLVDGAHARGMAVILDIAVNGTSWDHPWRSQHPEFYTGGQLGPYADIAALNLNNAGARAAIVDAMRYWIFAANIDGYRFDYANHAPISFWQQVISNLRGISSHKLLMFAEGERPEHFTAGFDMNFGFAWFYEGLANVAGGGSVRDRFNALNSSEYQMASATQQVVRYTGSHDSYTNDYYGVAGGARPFLVFNNHAGTVANFLVSAYMKGVPFLMSGQEVDYNMWTPWPWSDPALDITWGQNPSAKDDYTKILNFRKSSYAVRRGALVNYSDNNVCVFTKTSGSEKILVMVNMRNSTQNFTIPAAIAGSYTGVFSNVTHNFSAGGTWTMSPYKYYVLRYNGTSGGGNGNAYRIRNRWQNTYLYDNGNQTSYGQPSASDQNSHWELQTVDGHTAIRNVGTGHYLNVEGLQSFVECTAVPTSYWSAQWALESYDGHTRIRNRWQSGDYIHIENLQGFAQRGALQAGAWSSHWTLEAVGGSRVDHSESDLLDSFQISLYPNPVSENIQVQVEGLSHPVFNITVSDLSGKEILSRELKVGDYGEISEPLDLSSLDPGVYFIKYLTLGKVNTKRIIKR